MKNFISTLFASLIVCSVAAFFFAGLISTNFWAMVFFVSFLLAVLITVLMNQDSKIEELEKKMEQLLNNKAGK